MALSFEESKKQLAKQNEVAKPMMMATYMTAPVQLSSAEDGWIKIVRPENGPEDCLEYVWFSQFDDNKMSHISENKDITIDESQINISQESQSQFIPFEMPRYYDGIDLTKMAISIHFTNRDNIHAASPAVNVRYKDDKIRFAWLVDSNATHIDGNLQFEIHADGSIYDNKGIQYGYRWRSKPTDKFNIVKSLCQDSKCEPIFVNEDWVQEIVKNVASAVADQIKDVQVDLSNYYTKTETENYVNQKIASVDVSDQLVNYAKKSELPTKTSQLTNDSGYLTEHQDISNLATKDEVKTVEDKIPSIDGLATEGYVDEKVASVDVSEQLKDYAKKDEIPIVPTNISSFTNDAGYLTKHQSLNDYATKTYVGDEIKKVDVSDQLKDYA